MRSKLDPILLAAGVTFAALGLALCVVVSQAATAPPGDPFSAVAVYLALLAASLLAPAVLFLAAWAMRRARPGNRALLAQVVLVLGVVGLAGFIWPLEDSAPLALIPALTLRFLALSALPAGALLLLLARSKPRD
jgi:hypothetical protein